MHIYGWFLFIGYRVRILAEYLDGKYKKLPTIAHGSDFTLGWKMFWKAFPALLILVAGAVVTGVFDRRPNDVLVALYVVVVLLVVPVLAMHFIRKRTVASCFEFNLVRTVCKNIGDYLLALLQDLALGLLFFAMCLILVGFPAGVYTKSIFLAEFYRTHVKR